MIGLANLHRLRDDAALGLDTLREAEPLVETAEQRARLLVTRGRLLYVSGAWRDSIVPYGAARDAAEAAGDPALAADAWGGLADAAYAIGDMRDAERHVREAIDAAESAGCQTLATTQRSLLSHVLIYNARTAEGEEAAAKAASAAAATADWRAEINAQLGVASASFCRNDQSLCAAAAARVGDLATRVGSRRFVLVAGLYHARVAIARGEMAEARDILDRLKAPLDATSKQIHLPQFALLSAIAAESVSDLAASLSEAEARLSPGAVAHNAFRVLPSAALLWRRLGEDGRARASLAALKERSTAGQSAWCDVMAEAIDRFVRSDDLSRAKDVAQAHGFHRLANVVGGEDTSLEGVLVC